MKNKEKSEYPIFTMEYKLLNGSFTHNAVVAADSEGEAKSLLEENVKDLGPGKDLLKEIQYVNKTKYNATSKGVILGYDLAGAMN